MNHKLKHSNSVEFWNGVWAKTDRRWYGHFRDIVEMLPPEGRVIDAGCGCGTLLELIAKEKPNLEIEGRDYSDVAIKKLREKGIAGKVETLPEISGKADVVVITETLEHLEDDEGAIRNASKAAKVFIATVPDNRWGNDKCREHLRTYTDESLKEKITKHFNECVVKKHGPYLIAYARND